MFEAESLRDFNSGRRCEFGFVRKDAAQGTWMNSKMFCVRAKRVAVVFGNSFLKFAAQNFDVGRGGVQSNALATVTESTLAPFVLIPAPAITVVKVVNRNKTSTSVFPIMMPPWVARVFVLSKTQDEVKNYG